MAIDDTSEPITIDLDNLSIQPNSAKIMQIPSHNNTFSNAPDSKLIEKLERRREKLNIALSEVTSKQVSTIYSEEKQQERIKRMLGRANASLQVIDTFPKDNKSLTIGNYFEEPIRTLRGKRDEYIPLNRFNNDTLNDANFQGIADDNQNTRQATALLPRALPPISMQLLDNLPMETVHVEGKTDIEDRISTEASQELGSDLSLKELITTSAYATTSFQYPVYRAYSEQIKWQNEVCFNKQSIFFPVEDNPITLELKLPEGVVARFREEEGLYVPSTLDVPKKRLISMEHRLVRENELDWFDEGGNMKSVSCQLVNSKTRGSIYKENKDGLNVDYPIQIFKPSLKNGDKEKNALVLTNYTKRSDNTPLSYKIVLSIERIKFTHHQLFSKEHKLTNNLCELHNQYTNLLNISEAELNFNRICSLKRHLYFLREKADKLRLQSLTGTEIESVLLEINHSTSEIKKLRQLRSLELEREQIIIASILKLWSEIKSVREQTGYINTPVRIRIKREQIKNIEQDHNQWTNEIDEELQELKDEYQEQFAIQLLNYEVEYDQWKRDEHDREELIHSSNVSLNSIPQSNPPPFAPAPFDSDTVREEIKSRYLSTRRLPGNPILKPELFFNASITTENIERNESLRRSATEKERYFIRVVINGKTAAETKHHFLNMDFTIDFQEFYEFQLRQLTESIYFQIFQASTLSPILIAEIPCPIPNSVPITLLNTSEDVSASQSLDFTDTQSNNPRFNSIGAGINEENSLGRSYTTGVVLISIESCADSSIPQSTFEMKKYKELYEASNLINRVLESDKIRDTIELTNLDPNDPTNIPLLHQIRCTSNKEIKYFYLTRMDIPNPFISQAEFDNNQRFLLLQARARGDPGSLVRNIVSSSEIHSNDDVSYLFSTPTRAIANLEANEDFLGDIQTDFVPWHPKVKYFYQNIRKIILQNSENKVSDTRLHDVVVEDPMPNIYILRNMITRFFSPRRPLQPTRVSRKTIPTKHTTLEELNIVLRLLRGYNFPLRLLQPTVQLPKRKQHQQWRESSSMNVTNYASRETREFKQEVDELQMGQPRETETIVEILFQDHIYKTSESRGTNPGWNEEIIIPFHFIEASVQGAKVISPDSLLTNSDVLYFNIFDVTRVDIVEDERLRANTVQHRVEYNWLGSFSIPFHTILINSRIDGVFKVESPKSLFGYQTSLRNDQHCEMQVSLFITLDPLIKPQLSLYSPSLDKQDGNIINHFQLQMKMLQNNYPDRRFLVAVGDIYGKQVLACRFISPLNPPENIYGTYNENSQYSINFTDLDKISRYVSLIPLIPDSQCLQGLIDIWVPAQEFLKIRCGDEEEHATLLLNYLLFLEIPAWLVLGSGIPEGNTTYVLMKFDGNLWLWNPMLGSRYLTSDQNCPLIEIYTVIGENIYHFNIQKFTKPSHITYNFQDTSTWRTLRVPSSHISPSLQTNELIYKLPDISNAFSVQELIEQKAQMCIEEWRSRLVTRWNRHAISLLRQHLVKFEECYPDKLEYELKIAFESEFSSFNLSGFPLYIRPTNLKGILDQIYSTGIHTCQHNGVEFAIACYVHPYPNDILAIWIYVATLVPLTI